MADRPEDKPRPRFRRCGECEHYFDAWDRRAFVPRLPEFKYLPPCCPACHQMQRGAKAWAVYNSCNGIFTDLVFNTRPEAQGRADGYEVVPVRVLRESDHAEWLRQIEADEDER